MLFDDPVDNSGQLVSELSIPEPVNTGAPGAVPIGADQVLKSPDPALSAETASDTPEGVGAAEEIIGEPVKQGHSGESLYAESEGYTKEDASAEEVVDQPADESEDKRTKPRSKQTHAEQAFDSAQGRPFPVDATDVTRAKAKAKDEPIATETAKVKKAEKLKPAITKDVGSVAIGKEPAVKKADNASLSAAPKQPSTAKSLAAAVAEAKKPTVAPKVTPKLVRWYIQLGSFSKKENAMSLWESLREQGLPASLDTIQTDNGTSYRLRVGPELDGKKAAAMKSRLDKQNINSFLISE
jgi:DedD protein